MPDTTAALAACLAQEPARCAGLPRGGGPGPRLYNLFPLLFGPIEGWHRELPRIARLGFDWVLLNPVHTAGASGNLYAARDAAEIDPRLRGATRDSDDDLLAGFYDAARRHGLKVMLDLVVSHTAPDAELRRHHAEYYRAASGDLAELDYGREASRTALIRHFASQIRHQVELGLGGFRCMSAHRVPAGVWRALIEAARAIDPDCVFVADTLGAPASVAESLDAAGFDFLLNSVRWWDFRSDWLVEQYNRLRTVAPSIAFPESHDSGRLAAETGSDPARLAPLARLRYLFATAFSTGILMPAGFEHGFHRRLDPARTTAADWLEQSAAAPLDLSRLIAAANRMKAEVPALNIEGPMARLGAPGEPVVALLRRDPLSGESALIVVNPDAAATHPVDPGLLIAAADDAVRFEDVTPDRAPVELLPGRPMLLDPLEIRIFRGRRDAVRPLGDDAEAETRLAWLAENRIAIEEVTPTLDGGRFAVKRIVGDVLQVEADLFCDGHEHIAAAVQHRAPGDTGWSEAPMLPAVNDRWHGSFPLQQVGRCRYRVLGWRDLFATWRAATLKKQAAGLRLEVERLEGLRLLESAASRGQPECRELLKAQCGRIAAMAEPGPQLQALLSETLRDLMARGGVRTNLTQSPVYDVVVDRARAAFSAWYELFPRSMADHESRHGTFADVIAKLPYVRSMGFDVLYLPPIHPIGRSHRKGRNNTLVAQDGDPGVPYAIGSAEGGHDAIHPELGSFADFRRLIEAARALDIEVALDFAVQCSPDHPWIQEQPEWFDWRPDGTIQYAENPPKKYEDIVNVHFYRQALPDLWYALRGIVLFWVAKGVRIFRVDNPHTKPFPFWEWLIREVQDRHPDVIFLAEAFTRPKLMRRLAKLGFTQSYTYFTWRTGKPELADYLLEVTQGPAAEYMRPHFFVNTPDINPPYLHGGDPAMFKLRAALAATASGLWGLYSGFELCEGTPVAGKEEYQDSEKYQLRAWDWDRPHNIRGFIATLNRIRQENPALRRMGGFSLRTAWHDQVLCFERATDRRDNVVLVALNLEPASAAHAVSLELPLEAWGVPEDGAIGVEDLLTGAQWHWYGRWQQVTLDHADPVRIWRIRLPR